MLEIPVRAPAGARVRNTAVAGIVLIASLWVSAVAQARSAPDSFAGLAADLIPAVVNISTEKRVDVDPRMAPQDRPQFPPGSPFEEFFDRFFGPSQPNGGRPRQLPTSLGSGFIVDSQGYVVTNNHVVAEATEISVILHDERTLPATVIGRDPKTDLALLKIDADTPLPAVEFGDSDAAQVGDWVLAIGNPFGLGGTVTAGIVSARARNINAGPFDDFIQTDAPINRGNSGGPLFDMNGKVIGVNTAIYSPTGGSVGIGFAISAALAEPIVDQLKEHGRPIRGWLGVQIQGVTEDLADGLGLDSAAGALVAEVVPESPAAAAGFQPGDVIVGFDGQEIDRVRTLPRAVANTPVGSRVDVTVIRDGHAKTMSVRIGQLEEDVVAALPTPASPSGNTGFGLVIAPRSADLEARYDLASDVDGMVVVGVRPGSPAAAAGLVEGDLIAKVGDTNVSDGDDVREALHRAELAGHRTVLFLVNRQGTSLFLAMPVAIG